MYAHVHVVLLTFCMFTLPADQVSATQELFHNTCTNDSQEDLANQVSGEHLWLSRTKSCISSFTSWLCCSFNSNLFTAHSKEWERGNFPTFTHSFIATYRGEIQPGMRLLLLCMTSFIVLLPLPILFFSWQLPRWCANLSSEPSSQEGTSSQPLKRPLSGDSSSDSSMSSPHPPRPKRRRTIGSSSSLDVSLGYTCSFILVCEWFYMYVRIAHRRATEVLRQWNVITFPQKCHAEVYARCTFILLRRSHRTTFVVRIRYGNFILTATVIGRCILGGGFNIYNMYVYDLANYMYLTLFTLLFIV